MWLHPLTLRPSPGWGATQGDMAHLVLHSLSTGIMGDQHKLIILHRQQVC